MEDSGFDSGDRVANFMQSYNNNNMESSSNEDILNMSTGSLDVSSNLDNVDDLVFINPSSVNSIQMSAVTSQVPMEQQQQQKKSHHLNEHNKKLSNIKGLQRKLEQKVERAKKNFLLNDKLNQSNEKEMKKPSTNLIPINRLPFPRSIESQRLVEYKSDNSDEDDVGTFFPVPKRKPRRKPMKHKEDVDTFSIQEMTIIESDSNDGDKSSDDECDSQLNLQLPPRTNETVMDKIRVYRRLTLGRCGVN